MEFLGNEVESTGSSPYTILNEREQLKSHLELQRKKFELLGKELEKCETANEFDKLKCLEREARLLLAALEQEKADENVSKLLENHQRQRGELNRIIVGFEQNLEAKQALELEAEQLKGILNVTRHMGGTVDSVEDRLAEKEQQLQDLEDNICQAVTMNERYSFDEQHEAREVLISGWPSMFSRAHYIGIKRMGELWQEHIKDPSWCPFKFTNVNGECKKVINDADEKLRTLKMELGQEIHKAVTTALTEINDHNKWF